MWQPFLPIAKQALTDPREAATTLMSMGVPREALWPAFGLFVVLSALLGASSEMLRPPVQGIALAPLPFAGVSAIAGAASVFAIWKVGEAMEGTGSFQETLLLMVFLQGILFIGQIIEFVVWIIAPPIASLMSVALLVLAFWLNLNFIAALHGFPSLLRAFGCLLLASAGVALVLIVALTVFGISMVDMAANA